MALGVLVDANVLYSRTLRDWLFLLKLRSEAGMFTVYATEDIIAEVLYRLRRDNPNKPGHFIAGIHDRIVANIDDRITDFQIDGSFPGDDPDDAHVHAAAVASGARILLTDDSGSPTCQTKRSNSSRTKSTPATRSSCSWTTWLPRSCATSLRTNMPTGRPSPAAPAS